MTSTSAAFGSLVTAYTTPPVDVGAHGTWDRIIRRQDVPENRIKVSRAAPDVTSNYAIWRLTHEGRTTSLEV